MKHVPRVPLLLAALPAVALAVSWGASAAGSGADPRLSEEQASVARELIAAHGCPCGCGRELPGSPTPPACFGCSVGKAEISRILEGLAEGRSRLEIFLQLDEPILIDVFGDYTDGETGGLFEMAIRVAADFDLHRVVLRAQGRSRDARRAIRLLECARDQGRFFEMQKVLLAHRGPWDESALVALAEREGLDGALVRRCLGEVEIGPQVRKDREHAEGRKITTFPALSVNRNIVPGREEALRRAIEAVLKEGSL